MSEPGCSIEGCQRPHRARGWCSTHYRRWQVHGDPNHSERPMWGQPPEVRFWSKVDAVGVCWEWLGSGDGSACGYGKFDHQSAHRWAYENLVGPIHAGLTVDHQCRNRRCVNPDHMELVTAAANTLRGGAAPAVNARKTHCPAGHAYDNSYVRPSGPAMRTCRTCQNAHARKRYAARKAAVSNAS